MRSEKGCAIVLDSCSSLCSRERATSKVDAHRRDSKPKLFSDWISGISPIIRVNNISLFVIRHLMVNQGQGQKYTSDSGFKFDYRKDVSLRCAWSEKWEQAGKYVGKIMHIEVLASNFKAPVERVDTYLRFGYGIDSEIETVMQACDIGLISKGGSWLTFDFMDEPIKIQGDMKASEYLRENPEQFKILKTK